MTCGGAVPPARFPPIAAALVAAVLVMSAPAGADAQSDGVFLNVGGSHSRSPSGSEVDPSTYGLGGLTVSWSPGPRGRLFANALGGLSFEETAGDWASLILGGDVWTPLAGGRLAASLGARGEAFTVGAPFEFRALTGELTPRLSVRAGPAWLSLAGRGGLGQSEAEVRRTSDLPVLPPGIAPTGEVESDLWFAGGGPEAQLSAGPVTLGLGGHFYEADNGEYRQAFGTLSGEVGPTVVSLDLRVWDTPTDDEVTGGLTIRLPVASGWTGHAGGRRSNPDPLLQTVPSARGSFMVGRRLVGFGGEEEGPLPLYRVDPRPDAAGADVRFRLRRPDADRVVILGDFTDWEPVPMERRDGAWVLELRVEPGVHRFGFRIDGEWRVPEDAPGRSEDEWGRPNAMLVVEGE